MALRGSYQKGKIKRDEILHAAIEVFSRRGYRAASIREIAETVGLTQAGIFHYFASKEELFVEVLRVREELGAARAEDILEALRLSILHNAQVEGLVHLFVTVSAEAIDEGHAGHEYFRTRYERLVDLMTGRVAAGQDAGTFSREVDARSAARMLIALADGLQVQWLFDPDHTNMIQIFDAFRAVVLGTSGPVAPSQPKAGKAPDRPSS